MKIIKFTATEMIIVIAVLLLIATLAIPILDSAEESAKNYQCKANLSDISNALRMYTDNNDYHLPLCSPTKSSKKNRLPTLNIVLSKHIDDKETFLCPSDPKQKFFKKEGLSYYWETMVNGRVVEKKTYSIIGFSKPLLSDFDAFHKRENNTNGKNYLYLGSMSNKVDFDKK